MIIRDLSSGPRRFVELQRVLPGISTEQLRSRLNRMVADGLLTRERFREVPPRVDYELTQRAHELMPVLGALSAWGYRWCWDEPKETESIDIAGIFRVAPGLIDARAARGTVELTISYTDGRDARSCAIVLADDGVSMSEREAPEADAQISGLVGDWIDALGPAQDRSQLRFAGDEQLALVALDGLSGAELRSGPRVRS